MPSHDLATVPSGEIDMLEAMMERMQTRGPSPKPSTGSTFPGRPSSRASSASHLSHQSSGRSLHSAYTAPASDPVSRQSVIGPSDSDPRASFDGERTPSVPQGEWGSTQHASTSSRSSTPSSSRYHHGYDDAASTFSYQSRMAQVGVDDLRRPHSARASHKADAVPLRTRPRTATPPVSFERSNSPLRLLPRSPTSDRTPLEDLTFFREVGALAGDDARWDAPLSSPRRANADDSDSIHSGRSSVLSGASAPRTTSLRAVRLREEIEKEALRIKERASLEEMRRNAAAASALVAGHRAITPEPPPAMQGGPSRSSSSLVNVELQQRDTVRDSSMSGIPLYPGAPVPPTSASSSSQSLLLLDDARSVHSTTGESGDTHRVTNGSTSASIKTSGSGSHVASGSGNTGASARTEYGAKNGRARQSQSREWSQTCWVWVRDKASASTSTNSSGGGGGRFSKAPLIRDVPAALKRKGGKRESAHHLLSPAEALLSSLEDGKVFKSSSKDKEKDRDKEKGRDKGQAGPAAASREGRWSRATSVLRDDGYFRVFGDSDKTVIHNVHLPSLSRSDIRLVDHSLFGRPNCMAISRSHPSNPSTPYRQSFAPTASPLPPPSRFDETVYLCFPSIVATQVWLVMAQCSARPEFYVASGAATPRPPRSSARTPDSGSDSDREDRSDELASGCRIFRSLHLSISEGRALGELAMEVARPGPKLSWERPSPDDDTTMSSIDSYTTSLSVGAEPSPAKSVSSLSLPRLTSRHGSDARDGGSSGGCTAFCEIEMGGEVVAQTSSRKGSSPYWNETFVFNDLPPFVAPVTIRVLQTTKQSSRPHLIGTATVRVPDLPRHRTVEDWWAIKPLTSAKSSEVVGELSLGVCIKEEVVLPSRDYDTLLRLLVDDADAELANDIALEFPSDLEEVTRTLLRVYQAQAVLLPRILRLADLEVDHNALSQRSAALLFRGNTILTKSVELYLRLVGSEYLDASIGEVIRRICAEKVEIEIDPIKLRPGAKEKELQANIQLLHEWSLMLWNAIYDAREKCPHDLRQIFSHIQSTVTDKYGPGDDQKNTRWTCVSAFIFLRFFVPAVLNPKLFYIVPGPPDQKSQRTLTLVAKTLQGLANFSSFGQKEPWMLPMNSFVRESTAALIDFIQHVSTPAPPATYRQEGTSPTAAVYLAPSRLRSSLPPIGREGVPLLPHLIDLPRELGLLAARIARSAPNTGSSGFSGEGAPDNSSAAAATDGRCQTPSSASSRAERSRRFTELVETCIEIHAESRRRGGGLVSLPQYEDMRNRTPDPKTRTRRVMTGRSAIAEQRSSPAGMRKSFEVPPLPRTVSAHTSKTSPAEELHIRNPLSIGPAPSGLSEERNEVSPVPRLREESSATTHSTASRRSNRAFTINGADLNGGAGLSQTDGAFPLRSFSSEDLSLLASLQSAHAEASGASLPRSQTLANLATYRAASPVERNSLDDEEADERAHCGGATAALAASTAEYTFPLAKTRVVTRGEPSSTTPTRSKPSALSTRSSQIPPTVPTSQIRITQETTTTTTYVTDAATTTAAPGTFRQSLLYGEDTSLSPTSLEEGTPFESSFGTSAFSAPLMRPNLSQTSQHSALSARSGRSLTSSASNVSILAEVTAGQASKTPGVAGASASGPPGMGRRASAAGISLAGIGRRTTGSISGLSGSSLGGSSTAPAGGASMVRGDQSDGGSSGRGSNPAGGKGGLLSRAIGRKGSRAS